jgi:EmrB/QacA subfamily drug resistance transporter
MAQETDSGPIRLRSRTGALTLVAAILASGLGFLMNSAVTIALPTIHESLNAPLNVAQWVVSAYVLTLGSLILASGSLGDLFGRKRVFNLGILIFTLGGLLSGLAPTVPLLIGVRALQGVGAALMVPGSLSIINATFAREERGRAIGLWAGVSGAVAALGPVVGGLLADLSWRLVFLAMVPIGVAAYVASVLFVPKSSLRHARRVDIVGIVLVLMGLFGLSLAFIRLPEWGASAPTALAAGGGVLALGLFLIWELRTSDPVLPYRIFTRNVAGANGATFFLYFAFQGIFFLLSFQVQELLGFSSSVAGLTILPATLVIAFFSGPSGYVTDRWGPRFQMTLGPAVVVLGATLLILLTAPETGVLTLIPAVLIVGGGMVLVIPAITKTALDVPEELSGAASGTNNALARVAGLFAVAVIGAILVIAFRVELLSALEQTELARQEIRAIADRAASLGALELPDSVSAQTADSVRAIMDEALAHAFRYTMVVNVAAASASLVIAAATIRNDSEGR